MDNFVFDPVCGSDVRDVIKLCCKQAKLENHDVTIKNFNGVDITITPDTNENQAYANWQAKLNANATAYRKTETYKRGQIEEQKKLKLSQRIVTSLIDNLPAKPTLDYLIRWLVKFSKYADHIKVKYDREKLIAKLEGLGFTANMHVTTDKQSVASWSRKTMGEYIVGQAISCLRHGLPPHPMFAEKYFKQEG